MRAPPPYILRLGEGEREQATRPASREDQGGYLREGVGLAPSFVNLTGSELRPSSVPTNWMSHRCHRYLIGRQIIPSLRSETDDKQARANIHQLQLVHKL